MTNAPRTPPATDLAALHLFRGCSRRELDLVGAMSTPVSVQPGRELCRQHEPGQTFFVILEGTATVRVDEEDVATLGPGCGFGEIALLRGGGRRNATVTAATRLAVLVMTRPEFAAVVAEVPTVARRLLQESGRRLAGSGTAGPQLGATS